jgi:hypothetical protein
MKWKAGQNLHLGITDYDKTSSSKRNLNKSILKTAAKRHELDWKMEAEVW